VTGGRLDAAGEVAGAAWAGDTSIGAAGAGDAGAGAAAIGAAEAGAPRRSGIATAFPREDEARRNDQLAAGVFFLAWLVLWVLTLWTAV
jgi:hypothetical protein